ncbi:MAG TPA: Flp pilus assembly protein CpaB [Gemmatales bacterium]|nr:Flp pilus assembly protein CpaB [Gemmatales bacterium]
MQSKTPLLMVTALVCGLGAAFGTWKLVSGAANNPQDEVKVKVLVPVADVAPYYLFQDAQRFTEMEWPKSKLREDISDTITGFDQIKGKTTRHYRLKPNEPIYKSDICDTRDDDINERLKNGEVAHSIEVTVGRSGGGFIQVGNHVNISATIPPQAGETGNKTQYILEDIEVLAVDNTSKKEATQMAQPPTRFLLRLTSPQALMLKNYQDSCRIDVDRRRDGDPIKVGDSIYYITGKRTSSIPGYQDDVPEATQSITLDATKLSDPTDDTTHAKVEKKDQINTGDLTEEQRRLRDHEVTINTDGTTKKVKTNAKYEEKVLIKKGDTTKKDEPKKEDDGKKDDGKTPGQ